MWFITVAFAWDPTPADQSLIRALSSRDAAPICADLADRVPDAVASFKAIVEHVEMPPWAPMRAATCLIEHHEAEAEPLMLQWVQRVETKGLAKLVLRRTHLLELERAERVKTAALQGPLAIEARKILQP